jgi:hypothetical protein
LTNTHCKWAGGTFLRQLKKVPPAHAQRVYQFKRCKEYMKTAML